MARVTYHVERTVDDRDQTERIRHLEAQVSALQERIKELEAERTALQSAAWRDYTKWKAARP